MTIWSEDAARRAADARLAVLRAQGRSPCNKTVFSYRHPCGATAFGVDIQCSGHTETILNALPRSE